MGNTPAPTSAAVSFCAPLMSAATTCAPSRTKILTVSRAMPEPAPVMTATFPSNMPLEDSLVLVSGQNDTNTRRGASPSADGAEELLHVGREQVGLFHR